VETEFESIRRCHACYQGGKVSYEVWELPKGDGAHQLRLCKRCARLFRAMHFGTILERKSALYKEIRLRPAVRRRIWKVRNDLRLAGLTTVTPYKGGGLTA